MRVLILGASGMLGNAMYRIFSEIPENTVFGSVRNASSLRYFSADLQRNILHGVDVESQDALTRLFGSVQPDVVINCVGLVKQLAESDDPLLTIPINSLLPHRLAGLCQVAGARLVHISTDCVFSGEKGNYREGDPPDAEDLYGRTKLLGEVDYPHAMTVRTSIIGHELAGNRSLINWFLSQEGTVKGYTKAIFSGLPTVVLAKVVRDVIVPRPELRGMYHVAAQPIAKFDLLRLVADIYGKSTTIERNDSLVIDRSLNPARFHAATGYTAPEWGDMIRTMHQYR